MPPGELRISGLTLFKSKNVTGESGSVMLVSEKPVILASRDQGVIGGNTRSPGFFKKKTPAREYYFNNIHFCAEELDNLFILQNQNAKVKVVFKDCYFDNSK